VLRMVVISRLLTFQLRQFNINSWARDPTMARIKDGLEKDEPLPEIYEAATEVYGGVCDKFFDLLGSRGKA
jgi:fructose-bisphosphate aldolase class II